MGSTHARLLGSTVDFAEKTAKSASIARGIDLNCSQFVSGAFLYKKKNSLYELPNLTW